jgi:hypothetical protein
MVVCGMLHLPMGWSALGGFESNIVDNGGPYRVRFASIAMLMSAASRVALGHATRLRRHMEVLEKSAQGIGPAPGP